MRLALPKSRLLGSTERMLHEAGITFTGGSDRDYSPVTNMSWLEISIRKVRAIPQLIALGVCDAGFCGLDLVQDSAYEDVIPIFDTGLNPVTIVVAAAAKDEQILFHPPRRPIVIATEYEHLADQWAFRWNLAHIIIQTNGSTEGYAPRDADIVFDCVETGVTLEANGLVVLEEIMESSTYLIANRRVLESREKAREIEMLQRRLAERSAT